MKIIYLTLILSIFPASDSKAQALEWKGSKDINDGVVYMHNPEKGLWNNKRQMKMEEVLSIGIEEGDEAYILSRPIDIASDLENNIYILDRQDYCVKIYDDNGQFINKIGRKGLGPKEFDIPIGVAVTDDNKLCVLERRKVSFFTTRGELIGCYSFLKEYPKFVWHNITALPGNENVIISRNIFLHFTRKNGGNRELEKKDNYCLLELTQNGEAINAFCNPEISATTAQGNQYAESWISASLDGKIFVTFSYPYKIKIYDTNRNVIKVITRKCKIFSENVCESVGGFLYVLSRATLCSRPLVFPDGKFMVCIIDRGPNFVKKNKEAAKRITAGEPIAVDSKFFYDLYDSEGRFLQSFHIKENSDEIMLYMDRQGYVYTTSVHLGIPKVRKYKISFVDK